MTLGGGLNEVDEVSAGVLKQDGGDWSHALWFTAETDTKLLQTLVLRVDIARYERGSWDARGEQCLLIGVAGAKPMGSSTSSTSSAPSGEDTVNQRNGPIGMSLFSAKPRVVV